MPGLPRKSTAKQFKKLMKSSGKARTNKSSGASDPSTKKISTYEQFCSMNEGLFSFLKPVSADDIAEKMEEADKLEKNTIDKILKFNNDHPNMNNLIGERNYRDFFKSIHINMYLFIDKKDEILDMFLKKVKDKHLTQEELNLVIKLWEIFENDTPLFRYKPNSKVDKTALNDFIKNANKFLELLNKLKDKFEIDILTDDEYEIKYINGLCSPVRKSIISKNRHFTTSDPFGEEDWGD